MSLVAAMWRRKNGSPKKKTVKKTSTGCDVAWTKKCEGLGKVCAVGSSGRRSCVASPEEKKTYANYMAQVRRAEAREAKLASGHCSSAWVSKCAEQGLDCNLGKTGRQGCTKPKKALSPATVKARKAKAAVAAKKYRDAKKALKA